PAAPPVESGKLGALRPVVSGSLDAYGLYRGLARARRLPAPAQEALRELEEVLEARGGKLSRRDLPALKKELARGVLTTAFNHRAIVERLARGVPVELRDWGDVTALVMLGLPALHHDAERADPKISGKEIDKDWFAAYFARTMAIEAFGSATSHWGA